MENKLDEIYQAIDEFVLEYPTASEWIKQYELKHHLIRTIALNYSDDIENILKDIKVPYIGRIIKDVKEWLTKRRNEAIKMIDQYRLEEYREIIMENYHLTISNLLNIAEYCYSHNNNLLKTCHIYCALGYPLYDLRNGNEEYLLHFMESWIDFSTALNCTQESAQKYLLQSFESLDKHEYPSQIKHLYDNGDISDYFPFTKENIERLVEFVLEFDEFDSIGYKSITGACDNNDIIDEKIAALSLTSDPYEPPEYSLYYNFYTYIFNRLNNIHPHSSFAVCINYKWLMLNLNIISQYFPELSSTELSSLLQDYSVDRYGNITKISDNDFYFNLSEHNQDDEIIIILYKLYHKTKITSYDLTDIWYYFVINKSLSYLNGKIQDTAAILQVAQTEYPENGSFDLPWKYVRFSEGRVFFYHPYHQYGPNALLPYKIISENSKESFMTISKSILWNFPFIPCKCEGGRIISVDEKIANYIISIVADIYKILSQNKSKLGTSEITSKEILTRHKSFQFNFLKNRQLKNYEIIPIVEIVSNSITHKKEPALLFTIAKCSDTFTLVYENTFISRATYVFIIKCTHYLNAVKKISSFFKSEQINKRSIIQFSRDIFKSSDGFLRVIRVLHTDNNIWRETINFYAKE